jgi:hypothetical protein
MKGTVEKFVLWAAWWTVLLAMLATATNVQCPTTVTCSEDGLQMRWDGEIKITPIGHTLHHYSHTAPNGQVHGIWVDCN